MTEDISYVPLASTETALSVIDSWKSLPVDPLVELNVGDSSICPRLPRETSPYWIYIRFRRQSSDTIHLTAVDRRASESQFMVYSIRQGLFSANEAILIYRLVQAYQE